MKLVMITGSTSGIGFETALYFARARNRIVLCGRDEQRLSSAKRKLEIAVPGVEIIESLFDLGSLASITQAAAKLSDHLASIDILINNAGIMAPPVRLESTDGYELQFATNYLGHYALTGLLLPLLKKARTPRVVTVSSLAARFGKMDFQDLNALETYRPWRSYSQSKLANLLFAFELGRKACLAGSKLVSTGAHPGYCSTNLNSMRTLKKHSILDVFKVPENVGAQSAYAGAQNVVFAATQNLVNGTYVGPSGALGLRGAPTKVKAPYSAYDLEAAETLWNLTREMTGVDFFA